MKQEEISRNISSYHNKDNNTTEWVEIFGIGRIKPDVEPSQQLRFQGHYFLLMEME